MTRSSGQGSAGVRVGIRVMEVYGARHRLGCRSRCRPLYANNWSPECHLCLSSCRDWDLLAPVLEDEQRCTFHCTHTCIRREGFRFGCAPHRSRRTPSPGARACAWRRPSGTSSAAQTCGRSSRSSPGPGAQKSIKCLHSRVCTAIECKHPINICSSVQTQSLQSSSVPGYRW